MFRVDVLFKNVHPIYSADLSKRHVNEAIKEGNFAVAESWVTKRLPKHFTREAYDLYGYLPRMGEPGTPYTKWKGTYTGRKLKEKGHTLPGVWSGESESRAKHPRIVATSKGVRVYINAPALNLRPKDGRIDLREEVVKTTFQEADELFALHADVTTRALQRLSNSVMAWFRWSDSANPGT